jgi:4-carboxymuconolactone decarboxylase
MRLLCALIVAGLAALAAYPQNADMENLGLAGDRFEPLTWDAMTAEQKAMVESVLAGPRPGLGGPFNVLLRSPEMGNLAQELGAYARFNSVLPPNLRELAIIMTARFWISEFEWYAHKRAALAAGVDPEVVDAIAAGTRPERTTPEEAVVYEFTNELLQTRQVSDPSFAAARELLGERGVVDLVGTVGYYGLVAMLLNVDRYPLPEGVEREIGGP